MTSKETTTADGQALYSPAHIEQPYSLRRKLLCWFMFETPIGRFIWKPTLEDDCLVYRPFWKL